LKDKNIKVRSHYCLFFGKILVKKGDEIMNRKNIVAMIVFAVVSFATSVFALPPRAFDGRNVPHGMARCYECKGDGYRKVNWFGYTRRCERCHGTGLLRVVHKHKPLPKPVVKHHNKHDNHPPKHIKDNRGPKHDKGPSHKGKNPRK
jgi:hypothetical protein